MCILVFITSCIRHTSLNTEICFSLPPKDKDCVEFLTKKPYREAIRIGHISLDGTAYATQAYLIKEAKRKAAEIGGDFVMLESSGVNRQISSSNIYGYPSIQTNDFPWGNFSIWTYTPSQIGIKLDGSTIIGFHLKSDAIEANVQVYDTLIGIDGYDLNDESLVNHIMNIQPGDKVVLNLVQNNSRMDKTITALPN